MSSDILEQLIQTIRQRSAASAETSYTKQLLEAGVEKCAKKFGEEAVEVVIAATAQDETALKAEAADLMYHLLVLLECRKIEFGDVVGVLESRMGLSGLDEKAGRDTK